ncbi:SGNH/GDSL hydrolase family protein [bacterium]|nr:SGNH/GDSL hydrolase family protein [bacterium]MCI0605978.1 SGNH/GDSL hydrolase family protein [bacterium]
MKTKKTHIYFILFVIISTIAGLEIGARLYLSFVLHKSNEKKFRFNYYTVYEHIPGFREGDKNGDWIVINRNGFRRTRDVAKNKPGNTFRIFFLGGSAAHGVSSRKPYPIRHIYSNETVDAYLERKLNREFGQSTVVEVINAAITGYQVFQHTQYLQSELLDYDPDMVIFFDGANDHYTNNPDYNYLADFRYQFWKDRIRDPSVKGAWDYFASYMADYSGLFRGYIAQRLEQDARRRMNIKDMYREYANPGLSIENHIIAAKKQFLRSVRMNLDLLHHEKVDTILGLQPMLVLRNTTLLSNQERAFLHQEPNTQTLYPVVDSELKAISEEYGVSYVDFNVTFNDPKYTNKQLFIDYCHLTPLGGEAVADALLPIVRKKIEEWATSMKSDSVL